VKLLLDQNISRKLVPLLREEFPDSAHVGELDLAQSTNRQIWDYAGQNNYVIVSKDSDFRQLAFLFGPPLHV
jgi:predicted nuclease of predicted toxin-antitoxin system